MSTQLQDDDNGARWLRFDGPGTPTADDELGRSLLSSLRAASRDPHVRCIVLTGEQAFSDDANDNPARTGERISASSEVSMIISQLRTLPVPTIACVNGSAMGLGASMALACDLRYGSSTTRLAFPLAVLGSSPEGGVSSFLARMVGRARAFDLLYTGRALDAEECMRLGLLAGVWEGSALEDAVNQITRKLATAPRDALGAVKRSINHAEEFDFDDSMEFESMLQQARPFTDS